MQDRELEEETLRLAKKRLKQNRNAFKTWVRKMTEPKLSEIRAKVEHPESAPIDDVYQCPGSIADMFAKCQEDRAALLAWLDEALKHLRSLTCGLPEILESGDLKDDEGLIDKAEQFLGKID